MDRQRRKRASNLSENRKTKKYRMSRAKQQEQQEITPQASEDKCVGNHTDYSNVSVQFKFVNNSNQTCQTERTSQRCKSIQVLPTSLLKSHSSQTIREEKSRTTQTSHCNIRHFATQTSQLRKKNLSCSFKVRQTSCSKGNVGSSKEKPSATSLPTKSKAINRLIRNGTFSLFVQKLLQSKQLNKFIDLIVVISSGRLPTTNIAWKSALYRAQWQNLKSTHSIRYDEEYCHFWAVVQLLFGQSATNVLRGPVHFSKVTTHTCPRNQYDPSHGICNFAVPSSKRLRKINTGYPKEIPVGPIAHTLDVAEQQACNGKQFTLSFDGKRVAEGFKALQHGDVDLWGVEKPMPLKDALKLREKLIRNVNKLDGRVTRKNIGVRKVQLKCVQTNMSSEIRRLRGRLKGHFYLRARLFKLVENNPDRSYGYRKTLSWINTNCAQCENVVRRGLEVSKEISNALAYLPYCGSFQIFSASYLLEYFINTTI